MKLIPIGKIDWRPFMKNLQNQPPPPSKLTRAFDYVTWKLARFFGYWKFKKNRNTGEK